jgi:hypothetical protein
MPGPIQMGMEFCSDVAGNIPAIRFYRASANTGPHVGSLWRACYNAVACPVDQPGRDLGARLLLPAVPHPPVPALPATTRHAVSRQAAYSSSGSLWVFGMIWGVASYSPFPLCLPRRLHAKALRIKERCRTRKGYGAFAAQIPPLWPVNGLLCNLRRTQAPLSLMN